MQSNNKKSTEFLKKYFNDLAKLIKKDEKIIEDLVWVSNLLKEVYSKGKKALIFGNGGSAAISSHFSVDLTKNAKLRCVNFNEPDLITCFSNDYGYEHWVEKAIDFYGDEGDILILISSSGNSLNMVNGANAARKKDFKSIITFSGFDINNPLKQTGDINLWVDSKAYNFVENMHQIWLLAIVDLIIGSREYSA